MKHARKDYNPRIQDAAGLIPEDEPVFLIRSSDKVGAAAVEAWANLAAASGADFDMVRRAVSHARLMRQYADEHGEKVPDMPSDA